VEQGRVIRQPRMTFLTRRSLSRRRHHRPLTIASLSSSSSSSRVTIPTRSSSTRSSRDMSVASRAARADRSACRKRSRFHRSQSPARGWSASHPPTSRTCFARTLTLFRNRRERDHSLAAAGTRPVPNTSMSRMRSSTSRPYTTEARNSSALSRPRTRIRRNASGYSTAI
jgi:hypothetical protein